MQINLQWCSSNFKNISTLCGQLKKYLPLEIKLRFTQNWHQVKILKILSTLDKLCSIQISLLDMIQIEVCFYITLLDISTTNNPSFSKMITEIKSMVNPHLNIFHSVESNGREDTCFTSCHNLWKNPRWCYAIYFQTCIKNIQLELAHTLH